MIYKLQLSNKDEVMISEEEFIKFKENISANFIEFERGIINPSFVISIIIDEEKSYRQNRKTLEELKGKEISNEDREKIKEIYSGENIYQLKEMSHILGKYAKELAKIK